jgi:hypothetical protein
LKKTLARPDDTAEILRRLSALQPGSARRWGRMNAHQMVCHLSDSFLCCLGRKPVSHAANLFWRTVVKWLALHAPVRWPHGIGTRPELDQLGGGTRPAEFAADVAQLRELVEHVAAPGRRAEWQAHPRFGPMSDGDWLRWGYLHMDHHLRQFGC